MAEVVAVAVVAVAAEASPAAPNTHSSPTEKEAMNILRKVKEKINNWRATRNKKKDKQNAEEIGVIVTADVAAEGSISLLGKLLGWLF